MTEFRKLDELLMMVFELFADARNLVPDAGNEFKTVYQRLNIKGWGYRLTDIILAVEPVPGCVPNRSNDCYLTLVAYRLPYDMKVSRVIACGSKADILEYLKAKNLPQKLLEWLPQLESDLND